MDERKTLDKDDPGTDHEPAETQLERANKLVTQVPPFVVKPFSLGLRPGIDPNRLNQLNDELEIEEYLRKEARVG